MLLTDHGRYVVKWKQNPQHRRVLINEVIGAELLRKLRIASPDWAMVHVDERFLRANPAARVYSGQRASDPVRAGWHFGSKVPVDPEKEAIYDVLPPDLAIDIDNLVDFFSVFVFDHWVDNSDVRQAIFFASANGGLLAQMIDNGYAFGFDGTEWCMRDRTVGKENSLLSNVHLSRHTADCFERAIVDIQILATDGFEWIRRLVPAEWAERDTEAIALLFDELCHRARRLPDLVAAAWKNLPRRPHPERINRPAPGACKP